MTCIIKDTQHNKSAIMPSGFMLTVTIFLTPMLTVVMPSVVMLSVIMLNVVAPIFIGQSTRREKGCRSLFSNIGLGRGFTK